MKRIRILLLITCIGKHCFVFGQITEKGTVSILDTGVDPAGYIMQMNLDPVPMEGNIYLDEEWHNGQIIFVGGNRLNNLKLRFDIYHNNLEFIYKGNEAKVCPLYLFESYQINDKKNDRVYKNVSKTNLKNLNLSGIAEVLFTGKVHLYSYTYFEIQKPTYRPEFDMGRRSDRIIKKDSYYLDSGSKTYEIIGSLKKNKGVFGDYYLQIEGFSKKNKLNIKEKAGLIKVITYYNDLVGNKHLADD